MSAEVAVRKGFSPTSLPERLAFAKELATANMLPSAYRKSPGDILLAMEFGDSLGIPTVQAMSSINVIEGKPSASAALISALVRRAGHRLRVTGDDASATATITRTDDPGFEYRSEWTLERAAAAGLVKLVEGKPRARSDRGKVLPWEAYTAALLKARAVTEVARDACQEALMGIQYTPEELGAVVDESGAVVVEPVDPKHRVDRAKAETKPVEDEAVDAVLELPEDFGDLVKQAEAELDHSGLLDLYALAKDAGDHLALASALSAGKRVSAKLKAGHTPEPEPQQQESAEDAEPMPS